VELVNLLDLQVLQCHDDDVTDVDGANILNPSTTALLQADLIGPLSMLAIIMINIITTSSCF